MSETSMTPFTPDEYNADVEYADCACEGPLRDIQFEACTFMRCNFASARLENISFIDCRMIDTDLSMAELAQAAFNGVVFERCRLRGVDWTRINAGLLSWEFHDCVLDFGNFEGMKLKKAPFLKCSIEEATFDGADLREAVFSGSKLTRATFANCDLRKADFRDTEDLALNLAQCRCDGLKLRLNDARATLQAHGLKVSA